MRLTLSEAKARLSSLVRRVARGESVTILRRGRPVARLVPPLDQGGGAADETSWLDSLEEQGLLRRAERPPDSSVLDLPGPRLGARKGLLAAVREERDEDR